MTPVSDAGPVLGDRAFAGFRALIYQEAGIALADGKRALLIGRLGRRLRELGVADFDAYLSRVKADPDELVHCLDAVCTNETHFFREPRQLECLAGEITDRWIAEAGAGRRERKVRIWSAACSTGEEPYSIAMLLHDRLAKLGWRIEIVASDLSTRALGKARRGVWPMERARGVPEHFLRAYLLRGIGAEAGNVRVTPAIQGMVRFGRVNLRATPLLPPAAGPFDAIFCRNVLIYFDAASRQQAIAGLVRHLAPNGLLFLGHAESLTGQRHPLDAVMPAVYRLNGTAA